MTLTYNGRTDGQTVASSRPTQLKLRCYAVPKLGENVIYFDCLFRGEIKIIRDDVIIVSLGEMAV